MAKNKKDATTRDAEVQGNQGGLLSTDSHVAGVGASFNQKDANRMDSVGDSAIGKEGDENPADIDIDMGYSFSEQDPVPNRQSSQDRGSNARDVARKGGTDKRLNR